MGTPNNNDDWGDLKTKGAAGKVAKIATPVTSATGQIVNDWVGYGDEWDYKAVTFNSAANISITITATDETKFTANMLVSKTDKNNVTTYSLKQLQSVKVKAGVFVIDGILVEKGTYYIGIQSTNAKKGGSSDYTISLNKSASVFYTKGNNADDWDDLKTKGAAGKVGKKIATAVSASSGQLLSDWVGYGDEYDYQAFTLNSAANLSLTITATDATKFTIYSLTESTDKKGNKTYSLKSLQSVTPKYDKATNKYTVDTKALLLEKGTYYLCAQSTNAKKGGSSDYTVSLNKSASVFYTKAVNTDDWDDLKTKGAAGKVGKKIATAVSASSGQLLSDWVGYGDEYDYQAFTLNSAANLSLTITATDATKFTIYSLTESTDKKGNKTYSLKSLQSVTPKYDKASGKYTVTTKALLLEKGTYYIGVQSTNAKKGGSADYTVALNKSESVFYTKGSNADDWDDLKTKGAAGKVGKKIATAVSASSGQLLGDWVGYGDEYDYQAFTLNSAASLSFTVTSTDAIKFAVCTLQSSTDKKGVTTYSLKQLQQVSPK